MMSPTTRVLSLLLLALLQGVRAPLKLTSNFANDREYPTDNRGDEDNISPPLSWSGAPKSTKSYVLLVESAAVDSSDDAERKTHWLVYDIPGEVNEMREELSGAGSSDVRRLGMKDDAGTPPVVVDPMGAIDGYVDPEIEAMQKTIYSALDESFEDRNRAKEGATSFGGTYYTGPSESGTACTFRLYALKERLEIPPGATREAVKKAMKGKIIDKASLTARISD